MTHQTVERCLGRALRLGVLAALDDSPRAGRKPVITSEAKTSVVDLACRKTTELGYPHELWRLLARHVRTNGAAGGHACLAKLVQGTVCKLLAAQTAQRHWAGRYKAMLEDIVMGDEVEAHANTFQGHVKISHCLVQQRLWESPF